jgi:hypothetical protein
MVPQAPPAREGQLQRPAENCCGRSVSFLKCMTFAVMSSSAERAIGFSLYMHGLNVRVCWNANHVGASRAISWAFTGYSCSHAYSTPCYNSVRIQYSRE